MRKSPRSNFAPNAICPVSVALHGEASESSYVTFTAQSEPWQATRIEGHKLIAIQMSFTAKTVAARTLPGQRQDVEESGTSFVSLAILMRSVVLIKRV
jgi:hypothetical protein